MQRDLSDTLRDVLLAIALNQPDPKERDAMLAVMRADGWLPAKEQAH